MRVGFVGLGLMGAPMAANLLSAGYDLVLYNRTREKAERLAAEAGAGGNAGGAAEVAGSPREVAGRSEVVITMLPGPPEVEEVFRGEGGLLSVAAEGSLLVDMSTSSPRLARDLAREARGGGVGVLDAPVSGGDVGAREGTLSIMVGGDEGDYERAVPLFEAMGRTVTLVGPSGAGQVAKAANQVVVAGILEALGEALVLGSKAGVDPGRLLDVLAGGLAATKAAEVKREKMLERDFEPGGKVDSHLKDLRIALETAREHGVALPATAVVESMFSALAAAGRGGWDHSSLLALLDDWSRGPL